VSGTGSCDRKINRRGWIKSIDEDNGYACFIHDEYLDYKRIRDE